MPFNLSLPRIYASAGWKVKIYDKERLEPPHATIIRGPKSWRMNLRNGELMDVVPPGREVPGGLLGLVKEHLPELREGWDNMHPSNPVGPIDA